MRHTTPELKIPQFFFNAEEVMKLMNIASDDPEFYDPESKGYINSLKKKADTQNTNLLNALLHFAEYCPIDRVIGQDELSTLLNICIKVDHAIINKADPSGLPLEKLLLSAALSRRDKFDAVLVLLFGNGNLPQVLSQNACVAEAFRHLIFEDRHSGAIYTVQEKVMLTLIASFPALMSHRNSDPVRRAVAYFNDIAHAALPSDSQISLRNDPENCDSYEANDINTRFAKILAKLHTRKGANLLILLAQHTDAIHNPNYPFEEVIKVLIKCGIDINAKDYLNNSALYYLSNTLNTSMLVALSKSVNIITQQIGSKKASILHIATMYGNESLVKFLAEFKFPLNVKDTEGNTALHYAVSDENEEIVEILLDAGASAEIKNNLNKTPQNIAEEVGNDDILYFFGVDSYSMEVDSVSSNSYDSEEFNEYNIPGMRTIDVPLAQNGAPLAYHPPAININIEAADTVGRVVQSSIPNVGSFEISLKL